MLGGEEAFKDTYFSILYPVVNRKCIISVQYSGLMIYEMAQVCFFPCLYHFFITNNTTTWMDIEKISNKMLFDSTFTSYFVNGSHLFLKLTETFFIDFHRLIQCDGMKEERKKHTMDIEKISKKE